MFNRNIGQANFNDLGTLRGLVPSIFEVTPAPTVSEHYAPIATAQVLEALQAEGWMITRAQQTKSAQTTTAKHLVRLRHRDTQPILQGVFPEIVLINSHDGTSSYQLRAGVYRLVCLNGMVVGSEQFCERVRHMGQHIPELVAASAAKILHQMPIIAERIIELHQTATSEMGNKVFAMAAIDARLDNPLTQEEEANEIFQAEIQGVYRGFDLRFLTAPRREEDRPKTLWNTFNILQERLLKGGVRGGNSRRRLIGIKAVDRDVSLNVQLWNIAEKVAEMTREGQFS